MAEGALLEVRLEEHPVPVDPVKLHEPLRWGKVDQARLGWARLSKQTRNRPHDRRTYLVSQDYPRDAFRVPE